MRWLSQQESRMEHGKGPDLAAGLTWISKPRAPCAQNPSLYTHEHASRGSPEANQAFRVGELNLSLDERQADLGFLRGRGPVARRPPRDDICDVDLPPIQSNRAQHAI
jgi:hypothetical protein